jgi:hypothetical protein
VVEARMDASAAFRRGNEAIAGALRLANGEGITIDFICECTDTACFGRVPLTLTEYREIRATDLAVTLPGHVTSGRLR